MNQIMDIIKGRRSRRDFLARDIPCSIIEEIIEAGRYAPSALNRQPWKFVVIVNKDTIKKLSSIVKEIARKIIRFLPILKFINKPLRDLQMVGAIKKTISGDNDTVFHNAPLLILIACDQKDRHYASKDCALASQNMMLYAHSLGISSCFIGRADFLQRSNAAKNILRLPPHHRIQAAIVFGYAKELDSTSIPERRRDNILNWIR